MRKIFLLLLMISVYTFSASYSSHDASGGGAGTIGDPFTLQELYDSTDRGDTGFVMATGIYTPSATIDVDNANACVRDSLAVIRGCDSDGTDNGTVPIISGSSLGASTDLMSFNVAGLSIRNENIEFRGGTSDNISIELTVNAAVIVFDSCIFDSATACGIYNQESNGEFVLEIISCEFFDNNDGLGSSGTGRGMVKCIASIFHHNARYGIEDNAGLASKSIFIKSMFYRNSVGIIFENGENYAPVISHCLFALNDTGLSINEDVYGVINESNIYYTNTAYDVFANSEPIGKFTYSDFNTYYGSGAVTDVNGGSMPDVNVNTSDPNFTSTTDRSENFTPQTGSPVIDFGLNTIGY